MDSQITFNQVKVQILNDTDATPSPKYPGYVGLKAEYDPEVSVAKPASFFFKLNSYSYVLTNFSKLVTLYEIAETAHFICAIANNINYSEKFVKTHESV